MHVSTKTWDSPDSSGNGKKWGCGLHSAGF
jgi:hypothetical protein